MQPKSIDGKFFFLSRYVYFGFFVILAAAVFIKLSAFGNIITNELIEVIGLIALTVLLIFNIFIYSQHIKLIKTYSRWSKFTKELSDLNRVLSVKVEVRTKQLEESYEKEVNSLHTAAIMGRIIQPILHDLATPISSVKGAFSLLENENSKDYLDQILIQANSATDQIIRIIENGKDLMSNRRTVLEFNPKDLIESVFYVLKDKIQKNEIKVSLDLENAQLRGIPALFERIVLNIILNSVEELQRTNQPNLLSVRSYIANDLYYIDITDNGRGISKELIDKIFIENFSSKGICNLGLGLKFVKKNIQKEFSGDVIVESKVGSYTKFSLSFSLKDTQN